MRPRSLQTSIGLELAEDAVGSDMSVRVVPAVPALTARPGDGGDYQPRVQMPADRPYMDWFAR